MPTKTWKSIERLVANTFGSTRNPLSGQNSKHTRSDSLHSSLFIETKYRKSSAMGALYRDTAAKALKENKVPIICTRDYGESGFLVTIHIDDLKAILGDRFDEYFRSSEKVRGVQEV